MRPRFILALLIALCAGACAQAPGRHAQLDAPAQACTALYAQADRAAEQAGVTDGSSARVAGFPALRTDRLLASYAPQALTPAQFDTWVAHMRALDRDARQIEFDNLPPVRRAALASDHAALGRAHGSLHGALDACGDLLTAAALATPQAREALQRQTVVPDDYDTWKRVVGLYWFTRVPFASGVRDYQREIAATFAMPTDALPLQGTLEMYLPPGDAPSAPASVDAYDALGIPMPAPAVLDRLFDAHAPVWLVDTRDDNDRIGALALDDAGMLRVEPELPVVYRRVAYTRYQDRVLLQLVYSVWFAARPQSSAFDLLSGHLDSLVWRVTLAPDGTPLVYDSMHGCGCYHQFFPTQRARLRPQPDTLDETAFVPQRIEWAAGQRSVLRIASATHAVQRVLSAAPAGAGQPLAFRDEDTLRSLPAGAGERRSAFGADGIVHGTQRAERYLFWPMGVRDAGAMRQWGRHATAFVGRRHFDEARLLQRYFLLELE